MINFRKKPLLVLILATIVLGCLSIPIRTVVDVIHRNETIRKLSPPIIKESQLRGFWVTDARHQKESVSIERILKDAYLLRLEETLPPYRKLPREVEASKEIWRKYQEGILSIPPNTPNKGPAISRAFFFYIKIFPL